MKQFIGIDIGGTSTKFGIVREDGVIAGQGSVETCVNDDPAHFALRLVQGLEPLLAATGGVSKIDGIGIGAPNGNFYTRNIEHAPNLKWRGIVPIAQLIEEHLHVQAFVTNDANAAALGEMKFGAARKMKNFIAITLGTGLGSGFVVDGKMLYGHTGFAGEVGHMIVAPEGRPCGCGRRGCLETYVSATGIVTTLRERLATMSPTDQLTAPLVPQPAPRRHQWQEPFSARAIAQAAIDGDLMAREILEETGRILGEHLANVATITSPQAIFLMGGLSRAGDFLFSPTRAHFKKNLLNIFQGSVDILASQLPEDNAAILGAAALAWQNIDFTESSLERALRGEE